MAKRKSIKIISKEVDQLIAKAKKGTLKRPSVQYSCGDGLIVIVINVTGKASWYARIDKKTIFLGDYFDVNYQTVSEKIDELKINVQISQAQKEKGNQITAADYFEKFIEEWAASHKAGKTRINNLKTIWKTTMYPLHDYKLKDLTRGIIVSKIKAVDQTPNNKHDGVLMLVNMLNLACEQHVIESNPIFDLLSKRPSPFPLERPKPRTNLTPDEFVKHIVKPLAKAKKVYLPVFLMYFFTAYNFIEFIHMRWSLIDLKNKVIKIPVTAVRGSHEDKYFIKPISQPMMDLLQFIHHANETLSDFVFQAPSKRQPACISDNTIREPWRQLVTSKNSKFDDIKITMRKWLADQVHVDPQTKFAQFKFTRELIDQIFSRDPQNAVDRDSDPSRNLEPERCAYEAWDQWLVDHLPLEFMQILAEGRKHPLKSTNLN